MFQLVMKVSFSIVSVARLATSCLEWWNMLVFVTGVLAFIADGLFGLLQKEYLRAFQLPMIRNNYIFCESNKKCLQHEKKNYRKRFLHPVAFADRFVFIILAIVESCI